MDEPRPDLDAAHLQAASSPPPVWTRPGRLSALSLSHSEPVFYGAFRWARGVLNSQQRPAAAGPGRGKLLARFLMSIYIDGLV